MKITARSWSLAKWALLTVIVLLAIGWLLVASGSIDLEIDLDGLGALQGYPALALLALLAMIGLTAVLVVVNTLWLGCASLVRALLSLPKA